MNTKVLSEGLSVVFAGGGCRTFWSLGALCHLRKDLGEIREWAGVSAGTAMAAASCLGRAEDTLAYFMEMVAANEKNAYWGNLLNDQPVFPHEAMYRRVISKTLGQDGLERLRQRAPVRIFLAYIKPQAPKFRTMAGAMITYRKRKVRYIIHGYDTPPAGLETEVVTAQDALTTDEICDMILASSSTPPVTKAPTKAGRVYVDGGFADNVPVRALSEQARLGKVLVLLTRPIPEEKIPQSDNLLYLAPSRRSPVATWDYTSPDKVKEAFDLGKEDAEKARKAVEVFLMGRISL